MTATDALRLGARRRASRALAAIWFAVIAWGGSFVAARVLLHASAPHEAALSPIVLAAARFTIASMFFLVPLAHAIARRRITGVDLLRMALLGQITFSLYFWLQYTGVQDTNASVASILVVGLIPAATAALAQVAGTERLSVSKLVALLLGFAGVVIIALQDWAHLGLGSSFRFGALCLVGNAFAFAMYSTLSKRWMRTVAPVVMTGGTMLSGAVGLLLLSLLDPAVNRWGDVARLDARQWGALLFLALVCSVAAYFAYNFALTRVSASRAAVYIYFEPVVAVCLGIALLGEQVSAQTVLGGLVIAASVALFRRTEASSVG